MQRDHKYWKSRLFESDMAPLRFPGMEPGTFESPNSFAAWDSGKAGQTRTSTWLVRTSGIFFALPEPAALM